MSGSRRRGSALCAAGGDAAAGPGPAWFSFGLTPGLLRLFRSLAALLTGGMLLFATPLEAAARDPEASPAPLQWRVRQRIDELAGWRARLAADPDGTLWLGACSSNPRSSHLLYRLRPAADASPAAPPSTWEPVGDLPMPLPGCAFVLDTDDEGGLWVGRYARDGSVVEAPWIGRLGASGWEVYRPRRGIWMQAMSMVTRTEGWIAGNGGQLLHLNHGEWRLEQARCPAAGDPDRPCAANILAIEMVNANTGWAVGTQGLMLHLSEGRWTSVPMPDELSAQLLTDLDITADGTVWILAEHGMVARYDGAMWRLDKVSDLPLSAIEMVSPDNGWIVGIGGTMLQWNGAAWRGLDSPTSQSLADILVLPSGAGWAVGAEPGVILGTGPPSRLALREEASPARYPMIQEEAQWLAAADIDGDQDADIISLSSHAVRLLLNRGDGTFASPVDLVLPRGPGIAESFTSMEVGDVDGDADPDLVIIPWGPAVPRLLYNRGGRLVESRRPDLTLEVEGGYQIPFLHDLDGDGDLDLYLARGERSGPAPLANFLLFNDGSGRFGLVDSSTGVKGSEKIALWGDLDGDQDLDLILPGYGGAETLLYLNDGHGRLEDHSASSGLVESLEPGLYMQGMLLDLDLDADLDLVLLGPRLYALRNDGSAHFSDDEHLLEPLRTDPATFSRLSGAGDLDHDGSPEILLQTWSSGRPRLHLLTRRGTRFADIAPGNGIAGLAGSAALLADWDGDGDLDIFLASSHGDGHVLLNEIDDHRFLKIRPRSASGARLADSAVVRVYEPGQVGRSGGLVGSRQVGLRPGCNGIDATGELHIGLPHDGLWDVEVVFADGTRRVVRAVDSGSTIEVHEHPAGLRYLLLAGRRLRAAALRLDLRWELLKLAILMTTLLLARPWLGPWLGTGPTGRRRALLATLLLADLWTSALLASPLSLPRHHLAQALAPVVVLPCLLAADRWLLAWRRTRRVGPYRTYEVLGRGGMGIVYRARHARTRQEVALKVLHPDTSADDGPRIRFLREARIMAELVHPCIVKVLDAGEAEGQAYLAMELLRGVTLAELLRDRPRLEPALVRTLLETVCCALGVLHCRGIVHRDIKSSNIFITGLVNGSEPSATTIADRVKLMDFGLARAPGMVTVTGTASIVGTLAYMAPERLRGEPADERSDIYSLGVVAYECLSGRRPLEAEDEPGLIRRVMLGGTADTRPLDPRTPEALAATVMQMLEAEPERRLPRTEAVLASLTRSPHVSLPEPLCERRQSQEEPPPDQAAGQRTRGSDRDSWQTLLNQARAAHRQRHDTEAQVLALHCARRLRQDVASDAPEADPSQIETLLHELRQLMTGAGGTPHRPRQGGDQ